MNTKFRYIITILVLTSISAGTLFFLMAAYTDVPWWAISALAMIGAWISVELVCVSFLFEKRHIAKVVTQLLRDTNGSRDTGLSPVRAHPFLNFVPVSSRSIDGINRDGYRSPLPTDGFNGARLYLAGDCTTFDSQLPAGQSLGYMLEAALPNTGGPKGEVINAGFSHYTSLHSLIRFLSDKQIADFDSVFLLTGINDVLAFVHTGGLPGPDYSNFYRVPRQELNLGDTWPGRLPWLFGNVPSLRIYSYWSLSPLRPEHWDLQFISLDKNYASTKNLERCYQNFHTHYLRQNLQSFIALCRLHETPLVLFTNYYQRSDMEAPVRAFYAHGIDLVNDEIRRVAAEQDVLLLDMDCEFPRVPGLVENKWHYTAEGNRERVRIISQFVQAHGLLARPRTVPDKVAAKL